jgi:hypothetical protein
MMMLVERSGQMVRMDGESGEKLKLHVERL